MAGERFTQGMDDDQRIRFRITQAYNATRNRIKAGDVKWARTFARDAVSWARVLMERR